MNSKLIHNNIEYDSGILCDSGAIYLKKDDSYFLMIDEKTVKPINYERYMNRIFDGPATQYNIELLGIISFIKNNSHFSKQNQSINPFLFHFKTFL